MLAVAVWWPAHWTQWVDSGVRLQPWALSEGARDVYVSSSAAFHPGQVIRIDAEIMRVTGTSQTTVSGVTLYELEVQRGTDASAHVDGAHVFILTPDQEIARE
jgi:hypothetical protein